eukprot:6289810-Pyramimonas_sp.AAC.1
MGVCVCATDPSRGITLFELKLTSERRPCNASSACHGLTGREQCAASVEGSVRVPSCSLGPAAVTKTCLARRSKMVMVRHLNLEQ